MLAAPIAGLQGTAAAVYSCIAAEAAGGQQQQRLVAADDLVPIFIFVVARCGAVPDLCSRELMMWQLGDPSILGGASGYYLAQVRSARTRSHAAELLRAAKIVTGLGCAARVSAGMGHRVHSEAGHVSGGGAGGSSRCFWIE